LGVRQVIRIIESLSPDYFILKKYLEIYEINYVSKYKPGDNSNTIEDNFD